MDGRRKGRRRDFDLAACGLAGSERNLAGSAKPQAAGMRNKPNSNPFKPNEKPPWHAGIEVLLYAAPSAGDETKPTAVWAECTCVDRSVDPYPDACNLRGSMTSKSDEIVLYPPQRPA